MNMDDVSKLEQRLYPREQEQSVIGALLRDNDAIDRVGDLRAEHFFDHWHAKIFSAITRMVTAGKPADVITTFEELQKAGGVEVPSMAYLNDLAQSVPSSATITRYSATVRDRAIKRSLIDLAHETAGAVPESPDDAGVLVDKVASKLELLSRSVVKQEPILARDDLARHIESIDDRYHGRGPVAISTGMPDLDRRLNGGLRRGNLIVVAGRPKMGKAQPLSSRVLLADGTWKTMGEITVGDELASIDGAPNIVLGCFPQGEKEVLQVEFSDGRSTRCCAEHLWKISNRKWSSDKVMELRQVELLLRRPSYRDRIYIPRISGDFGAHHPLPMDPYTLGALLGDGCLCRGTIEISTAEPEMLSFITEAYPNVRVVHVGGVDYRLTTARGESNPIRDGIRALGLEGATSHTKFIPPQYFCASKEARIALLQGLMDTDGWVEKSGTCLFSSASERLANDVRSLARSLGCVVRSSIKAPTFSYKGEKKNGAPAFAMKIAAEDRSILFRMQRKLDRCGTKLPRLNFANVKPAGTEECKCIAVSHPDRLYITDDYIVTHNTALALNIGNNIALAGGVTAILSMEMSKAELHDRNLASIGKIPLDHLLEASKLDESDWPRLTYAIQTIGDMALYLDDQGGMSLLDVRNKLKQAKRRAGGKLDCAVIDYLQLMSATGDNRNAQIESITRGLKSLAKELDVPIILLSQLNRKLEDRPNKRPQPADLRDSGSIEQDCDVAIFLYRDEVYNPDSPDKGIAEINVALNRQGSPGVVNMVYIGENTRFEPVTRDWRPAERKPIPPRRGFHEVD